MIKDSDLILVPEKARHFSRDGWHLFYDPVNVNWVRLNNVGLSVLEAIKKHKYIEPIAAHLAEEYKETPPAEIRKMAGHFIESLVDAGFLHLNHYKKEEIKFVYRETPFEIYLNMTNHCNLKCVYCFNSPERQHWLEKEKETKLPVLTLREFKKLVDQGKELGVQKFILTGGEPLLNPDTIPLAQYIKAQGLENELLTNGTLIDETNAKVIAESFDTVAVSLDTVYKDSHEKMRGKGTFDKAMKGIKLLKAHNAGIRVNSVITRTNVSEISDTWKVVYDELKCRSFTPSLYTPFTDDPGVYGPLLPEMEVLLREQGRVREHFKDNPGLAFKPPRICFGCGAGNGEISISPDGSVFPCHTLHRPELACGNVKEKSLAQILKESELLHKLQQFNVDEIGLCHECDFKYLCGGGCLAMNYNIHGDFYTRDNFYCDYLKQEQVERLWTTATRQAKARNS